MTYDEDRYYRDHPERIDSETAVGYVYAVPPGITLSEGDLVILVEFVDEDEEDEEDDDTVAVVLGLGYGPNTWRGSLSPIIRRARTARRD
ncbi:hypothetical protein ACFPK1_27665 [Actinomycetospora rhizophila]|uniref:Uncharacterized protein n=1 Tax=Actinomycetospora rhizophila TaxID=1416876 RepID=A0ABV9ZL55_9PSEU